MKVLSGLSIPSFAGNKSLISNGSDYITEGGATATEISRLSGVTSNIQTQLDSKQGDLKKAVFDAYFNTNPGWVKLGTLTGNSGGARFIFEIIGKQGWNDQNFPGHAIIHGATNFISTDTGQIAAGAGWTESLGTGGVAAEIALVRQSGYAATKFDLYIYINSAYVRWQVEVTTTGTWTTDIQSLQADPGTASNVFRPTRREIMLNTNYPDLLAIEALTGTSGFLKKTAANTWILDTSSYLTTSGKAADSELLDGINSDRFVYGTNGATTNLSSGIFGDIAKSGFYDSNTASDSPTPNTWTHIIHGAHSFNPGAWGFQLAANFIASNSEGYFLRTKNNGTWQPWRTIWTSKDFSSTDIGNWDTAYANNHTHDQSLNTSSSVTFSTIELTSNGGGNNIKVGDDVYLGDISLQYTLGLKGQGTGGNQGFIKFGSGYLFGFNGSELVYNNNKVWTAADYTSTNITNWNTAYSNSHTHNQLLNTTNSPTFSGITLSSLSGTGTNIAMLDASGTLRRGSASIVSGSGNTTALPRWVNSSTIGYSNNIALDESSGVMTITNTSGSYRVNGSTGQTTTLIGDNQLNVRLNDSSGVGWFCRIRSTSRLGHTLEVDCPDNTGNGGICNLNVTGKLMTPEINLNSSSITVLPLLSGVNTLPTPTVGRIIFLYASEAPPGTLAITAPSGYMIRYRSSGTTLVSVAGGSNLDFISRFGIVVGVNNYSGNPIWHLVF